MTSGCGSGGWAEQGGGAGSVLALSVIIRVFPNNAAWRHLALAALQICKTANISIQFQMFRFRIRYPVQMR